LPRQGKKSHNKKRRARILKRNLCKALDTRRKANAWKVARKTEKKELKSWHWKYLQSRMLEANKTSREANEFSRNLEMMWCGLGVGERKKGRKRG
jgi:hypothetical protein